MRSTLKVKFEGPTVMSRRRAQGREVEQVMETLTLARGSCTLETALKRTHPNTKPLGGSALQIRIPTNNGFDPWGRGTTHIHLKRRNRRNQENNFTFVYWTSEE